MTYADPNVTGFADLFTYANLITNNLFGTTIIFVIVLVAFMAMKDNFRASQATTASCFIGTLFALFFRTLELVGDSVLIGFAIMTAICFAWLWFEGKG